MSGYSRSITSAIETKSPASISHQKLHVLSPIDQFLKITRTDCVESLCNFLSIITRNKKIISSVDVPIRVLVRKKSISRKCTSTLGAQCDRSSVFLFYLSPGNGWNSKYLLHFNTCLLVIVQVA